MNAILRDDFFYLQMWTKTENIPHLMAHLNEYSHREETSLRILFHESKLSIGDIRVSLVWRI